MNSNLQAAKRNKNDEFYTQLGDIENELRHYRDHFRGKVVYLNCDDPVHSNFWQYFMLNFEFLGLKKLISTHYHDTEPTYKLEYNGIVENPDGPIQTDLEENGDFRSNESIELLKLADIVVTNPPFSLFREYVAQLMEYDKKFIILGNNNAITYKEIFPLLKDGKLWLGYSSNKTMEFQLSDDYERWDRMDEDGNKFGKVPAISWFTNMDHTKRHEKQILYKTYSAEEYPRYVNYDAIDVSRVVNIPMDYDGVMGVPITFMSTLNPDQFEILGISLADANPIKNYLADGEYQKGGLAVYIPDAGGKFPYRRLYARILIRNKNPQEDK